MRSDMHKVICEEPRHGGDREKGCRHRAHCSDELLPKTEGMRRPHSDRKWFGEHLGPLRRWLRSQSGRSWNDVYSEASRVIRPDSVVRNHIKFHMLGFVQRDTFLRDGQIWCFSSRYRSEVPVSVSADRWSPFYVDPGTGCLCEVQLGARGRWHDPEEERRRKTQKWVRPTTVLRQLNGIWFECLVQNFPAVFKPGDKPTRFDMAERHKIGANQAVTIYGRRVFCVLKRQLSRRELREWGLQNS